MSRMRLISILGLVLILAGGAIFALAERSQPTHASTPFTPRSLVDASPSSISQYALEWTQANDKIALRSGSAQARLSRPLMTGDLQIFGDRGQVLVTDPNRREHIVILGGDYLVTPGAFGGTIAQNPKPVSAKFLVLVLTVQGGDVTAFGADPTGALVKSLLGDPTLPDQAKPIGAPPGPPKDSPYAPPAPAPMKDSPSADPDRVLPGLTPPETPFGKPSS